MGFPIESNLKIDPLFDPQGEGHSANTVTAVTAVSSTVIDGEASRHEEPADLSPVMLATGRWSRWIAIAGGVGYVPLAPGTAGSLAGVLLFGAMVVGAARLNVVGPKLFVFYGLAVVVILLVGIYAAGRAEIDFGRRDDGRIVIDEVLGQLITLAPLLPQALWMAQSSAQWTVLSPANVAVQPLSYSIASQTDMIVFFFEVVTGFVLFRLFDVWKPGAIGWAERRLGGGLGVMADDVMAGLYAAACLFVLHASIFEDLYSNPVNGWSWMRPAALVAETGGLGLGVSL